MYKTCFKNIITGLFLIIFGWIFASVIFAGGIKALKYLFIAGVLFCVIFCFFSYCDKTINRLSSKQYLITKLAIWLAIILVGGYIVYGLRQYMIIDMREVYESAYQYINTGSIPEQGAYFIRCKNNFAMLLLSILVYYIASLFGIQIDTEASVNLVTFVNFAFVLLAMFLTVKAAAAIFKTRKSELFTLLLVGIYAPFYLWSPLFYTDTVTMFFPALIIFTYQKYTTCTCSKKRTALAVAIGLSIFAGYALKGSLPILLIALALQLFLANPHGTKQSIITLVCVCLVFFAGLKAYDCLYEKSGIIDFSERQENQIPLELWFLFGSHQPAEWYWEDYSYMLSLPDIETRTREARRMIIDNYSSYSPKELLGFIRDKNLLIWGDSTYGGEPYICNAHTSSWTHNFIVSGMPYYGIYRLYCNVIHLMTLALMLCSILLEFKKKKPDTMTLIKISLLGLVIFLSFWERNARYVLSFVTLILLCSTEIFTFLDNKRNNHE